MPPVHGQIDGILAEVRQFHLLNLQDEAGSYGIFARGKAHLGCSIERRHDGFAIGIDKGNSKALLTFFQTFKAQFDREGAERVRDWSCSRVEAIKRAEDIQLASGIDRSGVTQRKNFDLHKWNARRLWDMTELVLSCRLWGRRDCERPRH